MGDDGVAIHWDGSSWSGVTTGASSVTIGVWEAADSHYWRSGQSSTLMRFNGTTWTVATEPHGAFDKVYGHGPKEVGGYGAFGMLRHFDGTAETASMRVPAAL